MNGLHCGEAPHKMSDQIDRICVPWGPMLGRYVVFGYLRGAGRGDLGIDHQALLVPTFTDLVSN